MAAPFSNLSDLINVRSGTTAEDIFCIIDPRVGGAAATATVVGRMTSLWQYNKSPGGSGPTPAASAIRDNTSIGGLLQTNPGGGLQKFVTGSGMLTTQYGSYVLYDRLVDSGGLSGVTTTAQTTNLPTTTLTRYTDGIGNFIFVEISTIIGTSATTATIEYENEFGATKTTPSFAIGATGLREAQRFILVPLADGDYGVTKIRNIDLVATTGTAGNIAVGIGHWLLPLPAQNGGGLFLQDHISGAVTFPEILEDACICAAFIAAATVAPGGLLMLFTGDK